MKLSNQILKVKLSNHSFTWKIVKLSEGRVWILICRKEIRQWESLNGKLYVTALMETNLVSIKKIWNQWVESKKTYGMAKIILSLHKKIKM